MNGTLLGAQSTSIASAATTSLSGATGNAVPRTGTATITSFGSGVQAGARFWLTFAAAATVIHNGTSLIMPAAGSRTMAAGDVFVFESLGSGNWKCVGYCLASGEALVTNASAGEWTPTFTASNFDSASNTKSVYERVGNRVLFQCRFELVNQVIPVPTGSVSLTTPAGLDMKGGDNSACIGVWSLRGGIIQDLTSDSYIQSNGANPGEIQFLIDSGSVTGLAVYDFTISGSYELA